MFYNQPVERNSNGITVKNIPLKKTWSKEMQNKTGATGAHFHIGPDQMALIQFKYLINNARRNS